MSLLRCCGGRGEGGFDGWAMKVDCLSFEKESS